MSVDEHEPPTGTPRPAVFLDRDDTVIADVPYLSDPDRIRLLPGAADALASLRDAGYVLVLATNQSGVGRGLLTEARLAEIHEELERRLAAEGAKLDAIYYCTHAPGPDEDPDAPGHPDRKPSPGMLLRAAEDLNLDLAASWMIGDKVSDALAGLRAGCRSILVGPRATLDGLPESSRARPNLLFTAADLSRAAALILNDRPALTETP